MFLKTLRGGLVLATVLLSGSGAYADITYTTQETISLRYLLPSRLVIQLILL